MAGSPGLPLASSPAQHRCPPAFKDAFPDLLCTVYTLRLSFLVLLPVLAEDAIKAALADYKLKQEPKKEEAEKK